MALVLSEFCRNASTASAVGRISNWISRRAASRFTSSSLEVRRKRRCQIARRRHFQGISSPTEGVAEFLGRLLPLANVSPLDYHIVLGVTPSIRIEPNENSLNRIVTSFYK